MAEEFYIPNGLMREFKYPEVSDETKKIKVKVIEKVVSYKESFMDFGEILTLDPNKKVIITVNKDIERHGLYLKKGEIYRKKGQNIKHITIDVLKNVLSGYYRELSIPKSGGHGYTDSFKISIEDIEQITIR